MTSGGGPASQFVLEMAQSRTGGGRLIDAAVAVTQTSLESNINGSTPA